jgi:hypothetical protein
VKEVYGDEWIKAVTPKAKVALAKKLLQSAEEATDPTNRYVLLRVAQDIATQTGNADVAMQALDKMASQYQFRDEKAVYETKLTTLEQVSKTVKSPDQHRAVVKYAMSNQCHAAHSDQFSLAARFAELALSAARRSREGELVRQVGARNKEVRELSEAYAETKEARITLEEISTDPNANLVVGKYHCFLKGDWDKGLHMLALGGNTPALKEMKKVTEPLDQVRVGDGWWELAETKNGGVAKNIRIHAIKWYRLALPKLPPGLVRQKVEKRTASVLTPPPTKTSPASPSEAYLRKLLLSRRWVRVGDVNHITQFFSNSSCIGTRKGGGKSGFVRWRLEKDVLSLTGPGVPQIQFRYDAKTQRFNGIGGIEAFFE